MSVEKKKSGEEAVMKAKPKEILDSLCSSEVFPQPGEVTRIANIKVE